MLRHVSETSATIWVECDQACTVEVLGRAERTFCVAGHHYALLIIEGLGPATSTEYEVSLDGDRRWPEDDELPASRIRTLGHDGPTRVLYGSCRTAAPHEPPWTLDLSRDHRGRGVDALYAYAVRMLVHPPEDWPHLAIFLGDQIYADDSSPRTRERVRAKRQQEGGDEPERRSPPDLVDGFEEFTWLYQESWSPQIERWFLANVPTAMVFDDHDMIDDWNISEQWVADVHRQPWWEDHVLGGLMSYWLYQHLGNLSPHVIREEGILDRLRNAADGQHILRDWARGTEEFSSGPDHYHFNFVRELGPLRLVMIDARNGRDLTTGARRIVDENEWEWIVEACRGEADHLLIGSSLPVFVPPALHDLEVADDAVSDGRWGGFGRRLGEWLRRRADMEDWPAFGRSFDMFVDLLQTIGGTNNTRAPRSISVLSGDIH